MGVIASSLTWVPVPAGVWTRIYSGPLVQTLPFQMLEFSVPTVAQFKTITFTLDGFSAAPPFYSRTTGAATIIQTAAVAGLASSAILWFQVSPWCVFNILTSGSCRARIVVY